MLKTDLKNKKIKKLDGFYFSVISWILINPTYCISIFTALVHVHHKHLFSTRLSFQNPLYATKICFCIFACAQLHISSFACKLLSRHSTLIAKVHSCILFHFCIIIIMLYLSKIRGILKLLFFALTFTSTHTLGVRLKSIDNI